MDNARTDIPPPFMSKLILSPERPTKVMLPIDDAPLVMKNNTTVETVPVVEMALSTTVDKKPLLKKTITTKTTTTTETIVTEEVTPALPTPSLKTIAIKSPATKKFRTTRPLRTYLDASSVLQTLDTPLVNNNQPPPGYTGKFDPKWYSQKKVTYLHPEKGLMEITELVPIYMSDCSKRKSPVHALGKGVVEPEPVHIRSFNNQSPIHDLEKGIVEPEPVHFEPKPKRAPIHDLEKGIIEPETVHVQSEKVQAEPQSKHSSYSSFATFAEKTAPIQLGPKKYGKILRNARHTFYNVYRRLFSIVFAANMIGLGFLLYKFRGSKDSSPLLLEHLATGAAANIMVALLARQDYIVNLMFKATWLCPLSAPLRLRRILGKVYEYGGVHSGAACSSVIWFALFAGYLCRDFAFGSLRDPAIMTLTFVLLSVLVTLCITAYPAFRFKSHNTFENIHRWGGWFSLAVFWAELVLFTRTQHTPNLGLALIKLPAFWFLLVSSCHAIYPWLLFHKLHIRAEWLSGHVTRLHFDEPVPNFVGLRISDAPLKEWHSFACIPARDGKGGSVLISKAGDWTTKTINNPRPYYWVKGIPVTGVMCMARIFKRIVVVTTGSGIGPVLAVIQDLHPSQHLRVIWSTPHPWTTYGETIINAVTDIDPQAMIINSRASKTRPDLIGYAWEMYHREKAEAVFVISNPKTTRKLVYGLESRGVPCFGPVWDS